MYANVVYKVHMTLILRELWRRRSPRALAFVILVDRAESVFSKPAAELSSWLHGSAPICARKRPRGDAYPPWPERHHSAEKRAFVKDAKLDGAGELDVEHCLEAAAARRVASSSLSYVNPGPAGMPG